MVSKFTIIQQYSKYLDAISRDSGNGIPSLFEKLVGFLIREKETMPSKMFYVIYSHCIKVTVGSVMNKKVNLKSLSKNWSTSTLKEFWRLMDLVKKYSSREDDEDALKTSYDALKSLIEGCNDVCLLLFMNMKFFNSNFGKARLEKMKQYDNVVSTLLQANSEEEVDEILGIASTNEEEQKVEEFEEAAVDEEIGEFEFEFVQEILNEYTKWLDDLKTCENIEESYSNMVETINKLPPYLEWMIKHLLLDSHINYLRAKHSKFKFIEPSDELQSFIKFRIDYETLKMVLQEHPLWMPTVYRYLRPLNEDELFYMIKELQKLKEMEFVSYTDYTIAEDYLKYVYKTKNYANEQEIPIGLVNEKKGKSIPTPKVYDGEKMLQELDEEEAEAAITE